MGRKKGYRKENSFDTNFIIRTTKKMKEDGIFAAKYLDISIPDVFREYLDKLIKQATKQSIIDEREHTRINGDRQDENSM